MKHIASTESDSYLIPSPDELSVQPNAVDLRIGRIFKFVEGSTFCISETIKTHRQTEELLPSSHGWWELEPGAYEVQFDQNISMGDRESGWVITRSTLNRNGLFLTSGLYDSGYNGAMAGCLHVSGGPAQIAKGTRIGQFLLFSAESLKKYDGSYGFNADGTVKHDEQKYHGVK